ncbi:MAG: flagellar filament capping protein FliD [Gammaproteobacteria bacterium]|nr:flagellar filament capping protein FliD [Gammaproteobacteria bacterium]
MISAPGVGTGLDINSLVQQLVSAEGDAKTAQLAGKRSTVEAKISAFGSLKSALSSLQTSLTSLKDPVTFSSSTATSGDPEVFTASVTGSPGNGVFQVQVQTLAEAHRVISDGYASSGTVVGTGDLTIQVGSNAFTITIDSNNDTLSEIRDAINTATTNTGVTASIVNVDDGMGGTEAKLVFTSDETGTDNEITITVDDDDLDDTDANGLSAMVYDPDGSGITNASEANAAVDSVIFIDGQQVTSSTNTVTGALDGVTINLLAADPGNTHDLTLALDKNKITNAVTTLVNNFNLLANLVSDLTAYDAESGAAGVLIGDLTLLTLDSRIRKELTDTVNGLTGDLTNIVSLGITTNADGTLSFDSSKLSDALDSNLQAVADIFSSEDGVAVQLDSLLDGFLTTNGVIQGKTDGLNNTLEDIDESLAALGLRLESLEERLLAQFTALDTLVARLNSTSSFLTRELANLPIPGSN